MVTGDVEERKAPARSYLLATLQQDRSSGPSHQPARSVISAADPQASAACGLAGPTQRGLLAAGLVSLVVVVVGEKLPARTRQGLLLSLQTSEENPSPDEAEGFDQDSFLPAHTASAGTARPRSKALDLRRPRVFDFPRHCGCLNSFFSAFLFVQASSSLRPASQHKKTNPADDY